MTLAVKITLNFNTNKPTNRSLVSDNFSQRTDNCHCNGIQTYPANTALILVYVRRKPVAWTEYWVNRWLKKSFEFLFESMGRYCGHRKYKQNNVLKLSNLSPFVYNKLNVVSRIDGVIERAENIARK